MKFLTLTCLCVFVLMAGPVFGATVDVDATPSTSTVNLNDVFDISIAANYGGPATLAGGSLSVSFDPAVLQVVSVTVNPAISDIGSASGTIDNVAGTIDTIGFSSFFGVSGSFEIATISLQAVGLGSSNVVLSDPMDPVFTWTNFDFGAGPFGDAVDPNFSNAAVAVVPVPPALLLFTFAVPAVLRARRERVSV